MTKAPVDVRRHDLDALRAFAMLLGIALHAALSFMDIPWVVQDRSRTPAFGFAVLAIHGFRMPLFFLLSGFFTAMLWRRRGLGGLLLHRTKRIALPLALGCVTIVPAVWAVLIWAAIGQSVTRADPGRDIWTAAVHGDMDLVRRHVERGAALDGQDPTSGQGPLAWAIIGDRPEVVAYLLEAGADASAQFRDQNTALHTAAFFGRADAAEQLLNAGADANARNVRGETPLDVMRHGQGATELIAGFLEVSVDFAAVVEGRDRIRAMLEARGVTTGPADGDPDGSLGDVLRAVLEGLMLFPFFHHLWFLWFLCWLVAGFALVVVVGRALPRVPLPRALVATPLCLVWLAPLTMLTQSLMNRDGMTMGFGPDTSAGLVPIPHVLAHYAIFFGFGAIVYTVSGAVDRLGRGWWIQLPLGIVLLPPVLALALQTPWACELVEDEGRRRVLADVGQVLYVWLMIFGLMGLFERLLGRARPAVRYVSDSSYWLYLAHLPLIIVGQMLLREVRLPSLVKFTLLVAVATGLLLASYQLCVRYTWIGWLLNGRRARRAAAPAPSAVQ